MAIPNETENATHSHEESPLSRHDLLERWTEIILAVMLGAVALATAWSGYQSARWGGLQSIKFSQAGALRTESMRASTSAGQLIQVDIGMFNNWVNAWAQGNEDLVEFYQTRFRPEFEPAFEAWWATDPANNPDAPDGPLSMPEYKVSKVEEADQLQLEAEATFEEGRAANQQSDDYVLNAVILASVLFLAGIATRFDWLPVRVAIIVAGMVLLVMGLYNLAVYPIA
ncbi:hypothetical protein ACFLTC_02680 [Chloroflexota bacterium]